MLEIFSEQIPVDNIHDEKVEQKWYQILIHNFSQLKGRTFYHKHYLEYMKVSKS